MSINCLACAMGCPGSTVIGDLSITSPTLRLAFVIKAASSPMLSSMAASVACRAYRCKLIARVRPWLQPDAPPQMLDVEEGVLQWISSVRSGFLAEPR